MNKDWYINCPVCGEQVNSGPDERDDGPRGPNEMTLGEAKEAYKKGIKIS